MSDNPLKTAGDSEPPGDTIKPRPPTSESDAGIKPPYGFRHADDNPPDDLTGASQQSEGQPEGL
jgi:hypothetical protein